MRAAVAAAVRGPSGIREVPVRSGRGAGKGWGLRADTDLSQRVQILKAPMG
jgi:hypothetical protein